MGVGARFAVSGLGDAHRLCGYADARAVHQRHRVGHQAAAAFAYQVSHRVVKFELARGRAVDAELVLEVPHADRILLFAEKERKPEAAGLVWLASRKHQEHVPAAVGYEPLDAAEAPCAVFGLARAQLHRLKVASRVGLGQDHGAGQFAGGQARQVFVFQFIRCKGVYRLRDALEAEDVHQARIRPRDYLVGQRIDKGRYVQPAKATRQRETHQVRLRKPVEIVQDLRIVTHAAVVELVTLAVHVLGPRRDKIPRYGAGDFERLAVIFDRVGGVFGRIVILGRRRVAVLLQVGQLAGVPEVELEHYVFVVGEEIGHVRLAF